MTGSPVTAKGVTSAFSMSWSLIPLAALGFFDPKSRTRDQVNVFSLRLDGI